jgi:non-ribosomal peptide synthetase component E (peptide arylation enzyme)
MGITMNLNVPFMLLRNVHENPDKLAVLSGDRRYTYRAFNERVNRLGQCPLVNQVCEIASLWPFFTVRII